MSDGRAPRLAISNIAWEPQEDEAVAGILLDAGFSGVEIAPTVRWPAPLDVSIAELTAYREWWRERGLEIVAMQSLLFGRPDLQLFGSEGSRRSLADYLERIASIAGHLGAAALVFGSPGNRRRGALAMDEAAPVARGFFRDVGARMAAAGVRLCVEPNPPEYGCDFLTTTAEVAAFCDSVDSPGIAVQGDLGAITLAADRPADALREAAPRLAHFHASEPHLVETGTGGADHAGAAQALGITGYKGWVSIEMKKSNGARLEAVSRAVALVKRTYGQQR
jgi:D-psicose/D-tagatose/L-ribulose 3-epimerase